MIGVVVCGKTFNLADWLPTFIKLVAVNLVHFLGYAQLTMYYQRCLMRWVGHEPYSVYWSLVMHTLLCTVSWAHTHQAPFVELIFRKAIWLRHNGWLRDCKVFLFIVPLKECSWIVAEFLHLSTSVYICLHLSTSVYICNAASEWLQRVSHNRICTGQRNRMDRGNNRWKETKSFSWNFTI